MTKTGKIKIIYFSIVFSLLGLYLLYDYLHRKSLYKNGRIVSAYVYEVNHGSVKGGKIAIGYYFYTDDSVKFYGGIDADLSYSIRSRLLHSFFPVLYDSINPNNNVLLVDDRRWEKLEMQFPDSLQWVKRYYPDFRF